MPYTTAMSKTYNIEIDGKTFEVTVNSVSDGRAEVSVGGKAYSVAVSEVAPQVQAPAAPQTPAEGEQKPVRDASGTRSAYAGTKKQYSTGFAVTAPLPGVIIQLNVAVGQSVKRGQKLAVLEAMKMENDILAERDGTITAISIHRGDSVLEGEALMSIG